MLELYFARKIRFRRIGKRKMPIVDKHTCQSIQCGATTQLEAGLDTIMDCAGSGYVGVRSCLDPICVNDLKPSYCATPQIPFSVANKPNPPTEIEVLRGAYIPSNPLLGHETKRRRDNYQEMVMCPGGETSEYMMGFETWKSFQAVIDKLNVVTDMGLMEWLGFLTPVVVVGGLGWIATRK